MTRSSRVQPPVNELSYRGIQCRAASLDLEDRSVEVLLATEAPVSVPDWERMELVDEVLLNSGAQWPSSRQVPLLDSHSRASLARQLGSIRGLRLSDEGIVGRAVFSSTAEAEWTKVREGHVTDVSVGYRVLKKTYVPPNESAVIEGRTFEGPVNIVTSWRVMEGSIVPIGADELAKIRGLAANPFLKKDEQPMNATVRNFLVSRGMPADLDEEAATQWAERNCREEQPRCGPEPSRCGGGEKEKKTEPDLAAEVRRLLDEERARRAAFERESDELCALASLPGEREACRTMADLAAVRAHLAKRKQELEAAAPTAPLSPRIEFGPAARDVHREGLRTAIIMRSLRAIGASPERTEQVFPAAERSREAHHFTHASLFDLARECLLADGINPRGLTREQVAIAALGWPEKVGVRAPESAYHVTGSFPLITADAVNKSMQVGYTEFPSTWEGPMRRGASASDFKQIHRIRLGAIPNIPVWPTNEDPEKASFADAEEKYAVEARSVEVSLSWKLLVNDDMDALSRVPFQLGNAASRTVNAEAWAQITSNPTMSDGVALFSAASGARKRSNLTTGAGAPSSTTLQTLTDLMMQMRGENTPEGNEGPDILALQPAYLVGPSALNTTIKQLVNSPWDPVANQFQRFNTATNLIPVIEPLLDANSLTAWYVFARPSQIDTVEVTFLEGQETPQVRSFREERTLALNFIVLQTFAAKAMNHRGIQKHAGA